MMDWNYKKYGASVMDIKYEARLSIWVVSSIFFVNIVNRNLFPSLADI